MCEELTQIALKEVEEHDTSDSLWIVIDNKIYDLTEFAAEVSMHMQSLNI